MMRFVILEECSGCSAEWVRTRCGWGPGDPEAIVKSRRPGQEEAVYRQQQGLGEVNGLCGSSEGGLDESR